MYHYGGNNPVKYTDPTGCDDLLSTTRDELVIGYQIWDTIKNENIHFDLENKIKDLIDNNSYSQILAGAGIAGGLAGTAYGIYSLCSPVKNFIDKKYNGAMDKNDDLLSYGFDLKSLSWSYNNNAISKIKISFEGSSIKNLKSDALFERVLHKINDERGNILKFNMNFNISENSNENNIALSVSFSFNSKYREKNYEEIISSFTF